MENEKPNCFLDTNILIYAYSNTEIIKQEKTLMLLEQEPICLSTLVINEFLWVMNRKFHVHWDFLKHIIENLFFVYNVAVVSELTIKKAIDIASHYRFPYWDSLMLSSALELNCEILYTEDLQHGQLIEERLRIVNPFY